MSGLDVYLDWRLAQWREGLAQPAHFFPPPHLPHHPVLLHVGEGVILVGVVVGPGHVATLLLSYMSQSEQLLTWSEPSGTY